MNGTELRSVSHFQILSLIAYPDLRRKLLKLTNFGVFFFHCKALKVNQDDQIQM